MASKDPRIKDLEKVASRLFPEFAKESDRGCVLLAAALLEGHLEKMLTAKLITVSEEQKDPLFDLHFGAKIDLAYRLGLISKKLRDDLHTLKGIRNDFAHNIFECDFDNQSAKKRLSELQESITRFNGLRDAIVVGAKRSERWAMVVKDKMEKVDFLVCVLLLQINLVADQAIMGRRMKARPDEPMYNDWK